VAVNANQTMSVRPVQPQQQQQQQEKRQQEQKSLELVLRWIHGFSGVAYQPGVINIDWLINGAFLNAVYREIDPRPPSDPSAVAVVEEPATLRDCLRNWRSLHDRLAGFYEQELQSWLVLAPANYVRLLASRYCGGVRLSGGGDTEDADELQACLLALLGVAAQSDAYKARLVESLQAAFDEDDLAQFVELIRTVMPDGFYLVSKEPPTQPIDDESRQLRLTVGLLSEQRDRRLHEQAELLERLHEALARTRLLEAQLASAGQPPASPLAEASGAATATAAAAGSHLVVEVADLKAKLRRLRAECDEKAECLTDAEAELVEQRQLAAKLKEENLQLLGEARMSRQLQDEIDILKERTAKCSRLEDEISRLRDRTKQLEAYRNRAEELRNENDGLHRRAAELEDLLERSGADAGKTKSLQAELNRCRQEKEDLEASLEAARSRIVELTEDNSFLESESKLVLNDTQSLEEELRLARNVQSSALLEETLSDSLNADAHSRLQKAESDKLALRRRLQEVESGRAELESEADSLRDRCRRLEKELEHVRQSAIGKNEMDIQEIQRIMSDNRRLETKVSGLQQQLDDLESSNERLKSEQVRWSSASRDLETARKALAKAGDSKREIEKEAKRLKRALDAAEADKSQLQTEANSLREELTELQTVQADNRATAQDVQELEKERLELLSNLNLERSTVASLRDQLIQEKIRCQSLNTEKRQSVAIDTSVTDQRVTTLESRNAALQAELLACKDRLDKDNKSKRQSLERGSVSDFLEIKDHLVRVERQNAALEKERDTLESTNAQLRERASVAEERLSAAQDQLVEAQSQLASANVQVATLQSSNAALETEVKRLQAALSDLQSRLHKLDKDYAKLLADYEQLRQLHEQLSREYETESTSANSCRLS
ncbi:hypothetical protein BOX15_Mlig027256g1, partial [Macrostomum lignano]